MPFTPSDPHITVALVMTGAFGQFADPLDWIARQFGFAVKVDRQLLAESLAYAPGGVGRATAPVAEALGLDKRTRFRIQVAGKCEGHMVAMCSMGFDPARITTAALEEAAVATTVLQTKMVLGVQLTRGAAFQKLPGLEQEDGNSLVRLLPVNVFNRAFFKEHIAKIIRDRKVKAADLGEAMLFELNKPWLFYDVPAGRKKRSDAQKALPFFKD